MSSTRRHPAKKQNQARLIPMSRSLGMEQVGDGEIGAATHTATLSHTAAVSAGNFSLSSSRCRNISALSNGLLRPSTLNPPPARTAPSRQAMAGRGAVAGTTAGWPMLPRDALHGEDSPKIGRALLRRPGPRTCPGKG